MHMDANNTFRRLSVQHKDYKYSNFSYTPLISTTIKHLLPLKKYLFCNLGFIQTNNNSDVYIDLLNLLTILKRQKNNFKP